ncbi:peptide-methionine (S)-S-oxide reductase [Helicobacter didelphidarum]|uniref:Peptide methionine sulfoxide reductase MsrA n=1 Tax=Helicobacter didelphidarum TaxID=2040648 RepID=A0A3D8IP48_9HELI|nr:peptide-methionine (S)-S-oxide reductase MsrA [Helicobacter didelphidarum]RDU67038.1 peptide-methionine (S)-S-oxide reductase [Helicobacter didelphidarum]
MKQIVYLAGGCFWGMQGYFDLLQGIISTRVGYANSHISNPSYQQVCSGITNAAEVIEIVYEDTLIGLCSEIGAKSKNIQENYENQKKRDAVKSGTQIEVDSQEYLYNFYGITQLPDCILSRFFSIINPTTLNKQGNDIGTQYRSGIYLQDSAGLQEINDFITNFIQPYYDCRIVVEVLELENFYLAESYHQKYLEKNPNGYCHIDISKAFQPLSLLL